MARLLTSGLDLGVGPVGGGTFSPDGTTSGRTGTGIISSDAAGRTGRALKITAAAGTDTAWNGWQALGVAAGATAFDRAYLKVDAFPAAATVIHEFFDSITASLVAVRMLADGTLELTNGQSAYARIGSVSPAVAVGDWFRLELAYKAGAAGAAYAEARINGGSFAASSSLTVKTTDVARADWGFGETGPGVAMSIWQDDVAINDSSGANQTSWPGDGKVALLVPTGDSAVGSGWSKNGVTNAVGLSTSVDNVPPVGIADATTGTGATAEAQIRQPTSVATANYDATMTTYTAAGIGPLDVINVEQWLICHGAAATTSPPTRAAQLVSNPAEVAETALTTPTLAVSTYSTGWIWNVGPANYSNVAVASRGTAPVLRVGKRTASTRVVDVCLMGIYVDYTPARQLKPVVVMQSVARAAVR